MNYQKKALGVETDLRSAKAVVRTRPCPRFLLHHRARLRVADKYDDMHSTIADIFEINHRCYGYRRIRASLGRQQIFISEKIVQRLVKQERLAVAVSKRRRYASYLGEISPAPENLINRDFQATTPDA